MSSSSTIQSHIQTILKSLQLGCKAGAYSLEESSDALNAVVKLVASINEMLPAPQQAPVAPAPAPQQAPASSSS